MAGVAGTKSVALGNALGNSIVGALQPKPAAPKPSGRYGLGITDRLSLEGYDSSGQPSGGLFEAGFYAGSTAGEPGNEGGGDGYGPQVTGERIDNSSPGTPTIVPPPPEDRQTNLAYLQDKVRLGYEFDEYDRQLASYYGDDALQGSSSGFASRNASLESDRASTAALFDQLRGSVLGDVTANSLTLLSTSGTHLLQSGNAFLSLASDAGFRQQALQGLGYAVTHPGEIYGGAVEGMSRFYEKPFADQATAFGQGSIDFLTGLGAGEAGKLGGQGALTAARYAAENVSLSGASRAVGNFLLDETGSLSLGRSTPTSLSPLDVNFSQRTVSANVAQYIEDMQSGNWDWSRSGPIRVMERDGQWVSYDNRRLMAARTVGFDEIPVQVVNPADMFNANTTWGEAFQNRLNHPWNLSAGGPVPNQGLFDLPGIFVRSR